MTQTHTKGHWDTDEGASVAAEYAQQSRSDLAMGEMSDFALANAQYLVSRESFDLIHYQTAAKERIRWLSAQLATAHEEGDLLGEALDAVKSAINYNPLMETEPLIAIPERAYNAMLAVYAKAKGEA